MQAEIWVLDSYELQAETITYTTLAFKSLHSFSAHESSSLICPVLFLSLCSIL